MTTYIAHQTHGEPRQWEFRSLTALARRLGGYGWEVEHEPAFDTPDRTVAIIRGRNPRTVITRVRIPVEALAAAGQPQQPGRPEIGAAVNVRISSQHIAELDAIAAAQDTTRAALVREAVGRYCNTMRR